jgi:hypothetical protein
MDRSGSEAMVVVSTRGRARWSWARQVLTAAVVASSFAGSRAIAEEKAATGKPAAKTAPSSPKPANNPNSSMDRLREKLAKDEKLVISQNLELTDAEAKGFWPLYDAYKQELEKSNLRIGGVVHQYLDVHAEGPIPNELATTLLGETLDIEKSELEQKLAHLKKVEKVLPPYKMVRYAQLENKIRAILKYDLAAQIPIAK